MRCSNVAFASSSISVDSVFAVSINWSNIQLLNTIALHGDRWFEYVCIVVIDDVDDSDDFDDGDDIAFDFLLHFSICLVLLMHCMLVNWLCSDDVVAHISDYVEKRICLTAFEIFVSFYTVWARGKSKENGGWYDYP